LTRERVAQQPPAADTDLSQFPTVDKNGHLYRAHTASFGPWYFSADGRGRFDLTNPHGTCYLADTVGAAVRERLGEQFTTDRWVAPEDAQKMVVSKLAVHLSHVADLESADVGNYPITQELTSMEDYQVPQAWARAFHAAGMSGIHYRGRFSYTAGDSWAMFGAGGPDSTSPVDPNPVGGFDACGLANIRVLPAPPSDLVGLTVERPEELI